MAIDADDVDDALSDLVSQPAEISTDAATVKEHSIPDLLELQKKAAGDAAASASPTQGLRFAKFNHRGTTG